MCILLQKNGCLFIFEKVYDIFKHNFNFLFLILFIFDFHFFGISFIYMYVFISEILYIRFSSFIYYY